MVSYLERYQTYIGAALKQIDTKLHNLPNMVIAECWFRPFDDEEGTIKFQWPHYTEVDGKMVQVSPFLEPQTSRGSDVTPWTVVEQGSVVRVKVAL
jgi:hypothetical protein